ncbi:MAG: hypothetical protein Q4A54_09685 [Parabacteroides sp.]|nr:hypothetical protein [Parabacteroides sp.]
MMDFITVPLVTGIVFLAFYKVIELFARRKERMAIIDKIDFSSSTNVFDSFDYGRLHISFSALKTGSLLIGIGLGMLIGLMLHLHITTIHDLDVFIGKRELVGVAYGAPVLLFGGLGLIVAFMIEMKINLKEKK